MPGGNTLKGDTVCGLAIHLHCILIDMCPAYVTEDWPEFWPLRQSREVLMVVEETEHFAISGIDATEEWAATSPDGFGFIRLGQEQRGFGLAMTHEQHCLRLIRSTLSGNQDPMAQSHVQYCLNYIRQMVLCSPDLTLEPADILERELDTERVYATHVCKDWRVIYDRLSDSWKNWIKYMEEA